MMLISNQAVQIDDDYRDLVTNPVGNGINPIKYGDGVNDGSLRASPSIETNEVSMFSSTREAKREQAKAAGDGRTLQGEYLTAISESGGLVGKKPTPIKSHKLAELNSKEFAGRLIVQALQSEVGNLRMIKERVGINTASFRSLRTGDIAMYDLLIFDHICTKMDWSLVRTSTQNGSFSVRLVTGTRAYTHNGNVHDDDLEVQQAVAKAKEEGKENKKTSKVRAPYADYSGAIGAGFNYCGI